MVDTTTLNPQILQGHLRWSAAEPQRGWNIGTRTLQDLCVRAMPPTVPATSSEAAFFPTPGPEHTSHLAAMAERRFSAGVVSCFANGGCPLHRERPPKVEMPHPFEAKGRRALPTGTQKKVVSLWGKDQAALLPVARGAGSLDSGFLSRKAAAAGTCVHLAFWERSRGDMLSGRVSE